MSERRKVPSEISALLVDYVLGKTGLSQESLAETLEVSAAFISRVRAYERSFTVDHLAAIEKLLDAPLGAILLAAVPFPAPRPATQKLHELAKRAILQADIASKAIRTARKPAMVAR